MRLRVVSYAFVIAVLRAQELLAYPLVRLELLYLAGRVNGPSRPRSVAVACVACDRSLVRVVTLQFACSLGCFCTDAVMDSQMCLSVAFLNAIADSC